MQWMRKDKRLRGPDSEPGTGGTAKKLIPETDIHTHSADLAASNASGLQYLQLDCIKVLK
jgi:hypothetical protein